MKIIVCPLSALETSLRETAASRMISLSGPGKSRKRPDQISDGFLALEFNDISAPANGLIAPNENHISALISFFQDWNQVSPLLIHCWMGISRSTAAAVIAHACLNPGQDMQKLAARLRAASPSATPNRLMIEIADKGRPMPKGRAPIGNHPMSEFCKDDAMPEGGFGWFLIREIVRDLVYDRRDGENILLFRILLETSEPCS